MDTKAHCIQTMPSGWPSALYRHRNSCYPDPGEVSGPSSLRVFRVGYSHCHEPSACFSGVVRDNKQEVERGDRIGQVTAGIKQPNRCACWGEEPVVAGASTTAACPCWTRVRLRANGDVVRRYERRGRDLHQHHPPQQRRELDPAHEPARSTAGAKPDRRADQPALGRYRQRGCRLVLHVAQPGIRRHLPDPSRVSRMDPSATAYPEISCLIGFGPFEESDREGKRDWGCVCCVVHSTDLLATRADPKATCPGGPIHGIRQADHSHTGRQ